ncbi:hypothetical protein AVEN_246784-1 [Araneus ventricosus]|uniref:Uncharacterized protein n=1 Tax=Araneus ventricosus TaxID=182803 RepID=A0A4Y2JTK8_ARAVE|nr:hypothetical protein AVEN_246784-1 [Araneus ventricosus]
MLQEEDIAIDVTCNLLKGLNAPIKDCRSTIVNEILEEAKQPCLALNVDPSFKEVRKKKKIRLFDEKCEEMKALKFLNIKNSNLPYCK